MSIRQTPDGSRTSRTKQLIQDALLRQLADKSFQDVTVRHIAADAALNRATFYAHYDGKQALLEDAIRTRYRAALRAVRNRAGTAPAFVLLRAIARSTIAHVDAQSELVLLRNASRFDSMLQDELYEFLLSILDEPSASVASAAIVRGIASRRKAPLAEVERIVRVLDAGVLRQPRTLQAAG